MVSGGHGDRVRVRVHPKIAHTHMHTCIHIHLHTYIYAPLYICMHRPTRTPRYQVGTAIGYEYGALMAEHVGWGWAYLHTYLPKYMFTHTCNGPRARLPSVSGGHGDRLRVLVHPGIACMHIHRNKHIHTYLPTYLHTYLPTYILTYLHTCNGPGAPLPPVSGWHGDRLRVLFHPEIACMHTHT